ncbi:MAG: N-acetylmuramoyl-L-alanine amidase [Burkholderiales bacterium]|nr:N-acetylmuramoyl-L-alanine amidase [Burkholderiales bacterium]
MNRLCRWVTGGVLAAALALPALPSLAGPLTAVRVWPGPDYTRLTLESPQVIAYKLSTIRDPERLVLDLEDLDIGTVLDALPARIAPDDPYLRSVRIGRMKPGTVRLVFDLKVSVEPQAFLLKPVGDYGHRLVLDFYPTEPVDAVMALLRNAERDRAAAQAGTTSESVGAAPGTNGEPESVAPAAASPGVTDKPSTDAQPPKAAAIKPTPPLDLKGGRELVIAIDAGHGGEDPGAKGRDGTWEKQVTLAIARKLKAAVDAEPGLRAVLTRDGDYFIPLQNRVIKARAAEADLFVSIHADAFIKPHARGSSVFALSERGATSAAARWLAKRENEADLIGGVNIDVADPFLKQVLLDLSQTATINDSLKLGRAVLDQIGTINTLHKPRVEQAGFAVLKAPDIPSILVETAFISNPEEEKRLKDEDYQTEMAAALLAGIKHYFAKNPPVARGRVTGPPPTPVRTAAAEPRAPAATATTAKTAAAPAKPVKAAAPRRPPEAAPLPVACVERKSKSSGAATARHCPKLPSARPPRLAARD